jgi:molybdenum cofactor cytidylyltransferase
MGTQKLLLPLGSRPVIARVVDQVCQSTINGVLIVAGADAPRLAEALGERRVHWITNPDPDGDMLSSIRCGLRALPSEWAGVMVVLGDQPGISTATINALLSAFRSTDRGIAVPICQGRHGHPLVFDRRYSAEILVNFDDVGLRGLPQAHAMDVLEVAVSEDAVLEDMDDPADYERMRSRYRPGA